MFLRHLTPAIGWALLILLLSSLPSENLPGSELKGIDKAVHFTLFLFQSHLFIVAFKKQINFSILKYNAVSTAISLSFLYGIVIEVLQGTVFVSRHVELLDIVANTSGALAGVLSFRLVYGKPKN